MNWLDLSMMFDPLNRIEGAISTFRFANWKGAYQRAGWLGLIAEFLRSAAAQNTLTFYVSRHAGWTGFQVEQLLGRYGIRIWNRGIAGDDFYFCVKARQARWAEYVMLRARVPLTRRVVDPNNLDNALQYTPDELPHSRRR